MLQSRVRHAPPHEQLGELSPRVEHARFDGVARDVHDLRHFLHRLFVIVDQIDDGALLAREPGKAGADDCAAVSDCIGGLRIVRRVRGFVQACMASRLPAATLATSASSEF